MRFHVHFERAGPHEVFAANLTLVRLLVVVPPFVVYKMALCRKPFIASFHGSEVRLFSCVGSDVSLQIAFLREALAAPFVWASEGALAGVQSFVNNQSR